MPLKIRPDRNKDWSLFPATKTVAFYANEAQFIELSEVSSGRLAAALSGTDLIASHQVLPVLFHEIRHWLDHVSTVWGRQRLVSMFDALNARYQNDEHGFWRIVTYRRLLREDVRDQYFSTIGDTTQMPTPDWRWAAQTTMGFGFDADGRPDETAPIVFARFNWPDGKPACRVPLTVAALLETNAVNFEIQAEFSLIGALDESSRIVEQTLASKKWFNQIYDPELGMYSAAVHLVANQLGLDNIADAYRYASALSSIALNAPSSCFERVNVPKSFAPWGARNQAALSRCNRSYLFLLLLHQGEPPEADDLDGWMEKTLVRSGLPSLPDFQAEVNTELDALGVSTLLAEPLLARFNLLKDLGNWNARALGVRPSLNATPGSLHNFYVCPVVTSDLEWVFLGKTSDMHDSDSAEGWFNVASDLLSRFSEFVQACR